MRKCARKGLIYQIMDLSECALFVVAKDDFHIIYANPKAEAIFGERLNQTTCYKGIETKQRPCMDCPFLYLKDGQEHITERYLESFDMKVKIKANGMIWEDGKEVLLYTILDSEVLLQARIWQGLFISLLWCFAIWMHWQPCPMMCLLTAARKSSSTV